MMDMYLDELYDYRNWRRELEGIFILDNVYGGYIGTKISKDRPDSVWEWLKIKGLRFVLC
jgi:hypothetical protein